MKKLCFLLTIILVLGFTNVCFAHTYNDHINFQNPDTNFTNFWTHDLGHDGINWENAEISSAYVQLVFQGNKNNISGKLNIDSEPSKEFNLSDFNGNLTYDIIDSLNYKSAMEFSLSDTPSDMKLLHSFLKVDYGISSSEESGSSHIVATPEPGTMLLFGTGLLSFFWVGRKKFFTRKYHYNETSIIVSQR